MENILSHPKYSYKATETAINYVKKNNYYKDYSLSFTGHSLGAWFAELSVFYCSEIFKYERVQAVTFDGPGSREMMEKLLVNKDNDLSHLEIISYFSMFNIVNCTNKHVGKCFTIISTNLKNKLTNIIEDKIKKENLISPSELSPNRVHDILENTCGHDLKYVLCEFNPVTEKPFEFKKVEKWPAVTYNQSSVNFNKLESISFIPKKLVSFGLKITEKLKNTSLKNTTNDSIIHLILEINNMNFRQYLELTRRLNSSIEFKNDFYIKYSAGYKVTEVNNHILKYNKKSKIDRFMKIIYKNSSKSNISEIIHVRKFYEYISNSSAKEFKSEKNHLEDVREFIAYLWHHLPKFENLIEIIKLPRISTNIQNSIENINKYENELIKSKLENKKILFVKGSLNFLDLPRTLDLYTIRLIKVNSSFQKSIEECVVNCLHKKENVIDYEKAKSDLRENLEKTEQKVLFILDISDQNNEIELKLIQDFINMFNENNNVKIVIKTNNLKPIETQIENSATFLKLEDEELSENMKKLTDDWNLEPNQEFFKNKDIDQIKKIQNFIENFYITIENLKFPKSLSSEFEDNEKTHVFVIGPTGSGKSTIINLLIGNQLISKDNENDLNDPNTILEPVNQEFQYAQIGNDSSKSKTSFARPYYNSNRSNNVFWDFPGFLDSRKALKKIIFADEMKKISEVVKSFKILLVLTNSSIYETKGEIFSALQEILSQLVNLNDIKVKESVSLIITKGDPKQRKYPEKYIENYIQKFISLNNDFSSLFCDISDNNNNRISLFPLITETNKIYSLTDFNLETGLNLTQVTSTKFNLIVDKATSDVIIKLNQLLNEYIKFCANEKILKKKEELNKIMVKNNFTRKEIKNFHIDIPSISKKKEIFEILSHNNDKKFYIENALKILDFNSSLLKILKYDYDGWFESFKNFNLILKDLTQVSQESSEAGKNLKIKACFISASELNTFAQEHQKLKKIKLIAFIFNLDDDLKLNGINLTIECPDWRLIKNQKVILTGHEKISNKLNSGNFFSPIDLPISIKGNGLVTFELDGVDGKSGGLNLDSILKSLEEDRKKLNSLKCKLEYIKYVKKFYNLKGVIDGQKITNENDSKKNKEIFEYINNQVDIFKKNLNLRKDQENENNEDLKRKKIHIIKQIIKKYKNITPEELFDWNDKRTFRSIKDGLDILKELSIDLENFNINSEYYIIKEEEELKKTSKIILGLEREFSVEEVVRIILDEGNQIVEEINTQCTKLEKDTENWTNLIELLEANYKIFTHQYDENQRLERQKHEKLLELFKDFQKIAETPNEFKLTIKKLFASLIEKEESELEVKEFLNKISSVTFDLKFKRKLLNSQAIKYCIDNFEKIKEYKNSMSIDGEKELLDRIIRRMKLKYEVKLISIQEELKVLSTKFELESDINFDIEKSREIKNEYNIVNEELLKDLSITEQIEEEIDEQLEEIYNLIENQKSEKNNTSEENFNKIVKLDKRTKFFNSLLYELPYFSKSEIEKENMMRNLINILESSDIFENFERDSRTLETTFQKFLINFFEFLDICKNFEKNSIELEITVQKFLRNDKFKVDKKHPYIDFYKINGTPGSPGSNSGSFNAKFTNKSNYKCQQNPGKGGLNSFKFEGYYIDCRKELEHDDSDGLKDQEAFLKFFYEKLSKVKRKIILAFDNIFSFISSRWISGPFLVEQGHALDGKSNNEPISTIWQKNEYNDFRNKMSKVLEFIQLEPLKANSDEQIPILNNLTNKICYLKLTNNNDNSCYANSIMQCLLALGDQFTKLVIIFLIYFKKDKFLFF